MRRPRSLTARGRRGSPGSRISGMPRWGSAGGRWLSLATSLGCKRQRAARTGRAGPAAARDCRFRLRCSTCSCCRSRPSWRAPAGGCSTTPATSSGCGSPTARPSRPAPCGCSLSQIAPDRSYKPSTAFRVQRDSSNRSRFSRKAGVDQAGAGTCRSGVSFSHIAPSMRPPLTMKGAGR